jgi:hypothetical protein
VRGPVLPEPGTRRLSETRRPESRLSSRPAPPRPAVPTAKSPRGPGSRKDDDGPQDRRDDRAALVLPPRLVDAPRLGPGLPHRPRARYTTSRRSSVDHPSNIRRSRHRVISFQADVGLRPTKARTRATRSTGVWSSWSRVAAILENSPVSTPTPPHPIRSRPVPPRVSVRSFCQSLCQRFLPA